MSIKYEDISTISSALCGAGAMINSKIQDAKEKGYCIDIMDYYEKRKEEVRNALAALQKIRKELHLNDDYAYNQKFLG